MRRTIVLLLGVMLIVVGLLGATLTWAGSGDALAEDDASDVRTSQTHAWMHGMIDQMMGAGVSERMHAAMPGSEAMMEACAGRMGSMMSGSPMDEMRDGSE